MASALRFNGSNSLKITFGGSNATINNLHTKSGSTGFEYEFKVAATSSFSILGNQYNYGGYFIVNADKVQFRIGATSATTVTINCTPNLNGEPHIYLVQRAGNAYSVYEDGLLIGSTTSSATPDGTIIDRIGQYQSIKTTAIDLYYIIFRESIGGTALYNWSAEDSDHSSGTVILSDITGAYHAEGLSFATDGSAWVDLGVVTTEETYNFSASINITPTLSALSSKNTNCLAEISQNTALTASLKKQTNISGGINLKPQQQATQTKKVNYLAEISQGALLTTLLEKNTNVSGTINQANQTQATQNKQVALTAEIAQSYVMYGYFSTEVIEIHQFSATISVTPTTSANFNKKINHESEITQTTELNSQVTKKALLQFNDQQKITLSANIDKYINITAQLQQPIALSAIFYNLTAPVHIYKFRINGRIVFQRFNGATVSQRFNGVIH